MSRGRCRANLFGKALRTLLGPRRHRDLNDPIISHASLLWFCENDPRVREPEGGLARPHGETFVMRQGDVLVALDDAGSGHKCG
jgi:hypothetical protein